MSGLNHDESAAGMHVEEARDWFRTAARWLTQAMGSPMAFGMACLTIIIWGALGPVVGYTDTWQLVINTGTTIVTFLMVFLIQNAQNRDARAIQLKLDEVIRALRNARNRLIDLEEGSERDLQSLEQEFRHLHDDRGSRQQPG